MGSVATTTNAGLTYLTQLLSSSGSPLLAAGVSSSQIQSALAKASPTDVAQLSEQAMQFQDVETLFGSLNGQQPAETAGTMLEGIVNSMSGTSSSSLQGQFAAFQGQQHCE